MFLFSDFEIAHNNLAQRRQFMSKRFSLAMNFSYLNANFIQNH